MKSTVRKTAAAVASATRAQIVAGCCVIVRKGRSSTEVSLCAKGIRLAVLARALNRYLNAEIYVPAGSFEEQLELSTSGRVTDVLSRCGLKVESKY